MLTENRDGSGADVTVKLIDFGLVKTITAEAGRESWCKGYFAGTPHYASPEQLDGGTVDARSDIYSLGRCLEYMLGGSRPRWAESGSGQESLSFHPPSFTAQPASGIPDAVALLLGSMTAADPNARPASMDAVVSRITECLATVDSAGGRGFAEQSRREDGGRNRERSFLPLALLGLVVLCAVVARLVSGHGSTQKSPLVSLTPTVSAESRALCAQGKEYFRRHTQTDNQLAIKAYSDAIARSPSNAEAQAALASVYYENVGRFGAPPAQLDLAVASAEHAIAINPNLPEAFQALGAIRNLQGQPWEALLQLHRALELNPQSAQAMCDFSLVWICVGHPQMALPWAKAATQLEPSKVQGWHAAAEASVELCADEQAEEDYRRCLELRPIWMSGHCGLMHVHLLQGDFARARQDFANAQSIQSNLIFPLTLDAQVALFSGEYADAEKIYRQLLAMKRDGYVRYYSAISYLSALGFLRIHAGDTTEGNALLAEAEGLHPANSEGPEDVYDLAAIRAIQNRQEEALTLLNQAVSSGWNDYRATRFDPRFDHLRSDSRFQKLLADMSLHVAEMRVRAEKLCQQSPKLSDYPVDPTAWGKAK